MKGCRIYALDVAAMDIKMHCVMRSIVGRKTMSREGLRSLEQRITRVRAHRRRTRGHAMGSGQWSKGTADSHQARRRAVL